MKEDYGTALRIAETILRLKSSRVLTRLRLFSTWVNSYLGTWDDADQHDLTYRRLLLKRIKALAAQLHYIRPFRACTLGLLQ